MAREMDTALTGCLEDLETVLVKLFRLFQNLFSCIKDERQYLVSRDAKALEEVSKTKTSFLSSIEQVEVERDQKTNELARLVNKTGQTRTLSELLAGLPETSTERIRHIQQGILSLQKEIREVNEGNYALANLNLQQVQAVQQFIINTLQPPSSFYGPNSKKSAEVSPSTWQMDQNV